MPALIVISDSETFSSVWPELAAAVDADLHIFEDPDGALAVPDPLAILLVAAGHEELAEPVLRQLGGGDIPVVVIGASTDHRIAASLVRAGATDYFALPGDLGALQSEIADRKRQRSARQAGGDLAVAERATFDFGRIVGKSNELRAALDRTARIIPRATATVLLIGETGTGKELLAHAIHYNGPRATAPFLEINCSAIPAGLLESELFGFERGAFTDARAAKPGLFEAADGGTLFLDEIGDLPMDLQGKILKAIEEKRVRRVGAVNARAVDVRIIAATHVDLVQAVRDGEFREDLFYRLSVIPIRLPPLRERGDDVILLARHFLRSLADQYDMPAPELTPAIQRGLLAHHWPGNVRELRNTLERLLLLEERTITPPGLEHPHGNNSTTSPLPFPASLERIEQAAARATLDRFQGNKSAAASALGISRSRLYRILEPNNGSN
ncbi:MAG TPA: sigma-54 dependent transcriptional regulator [Longimicrobiaceae bacterium]|nr:sigma-54 dependent transcriptional regulator [Longimicrobiaceae bacterium]